MCTADTPLLSLMPTRLPPSCCSTTFNHAAVLVGYDSKGWKLQNSM